MLMEEEFVTTNWQALPPLTLKPVALVISNISRHECVTVRIKCRPVAVFCAVDGVIVMVYVIVRMNSPLGGKVFSATDSKASENVVATGGFR